MMGMDAGSKTREIFHDVIMNSRTILWNGPIGVFEMENFSAGTKALGDSIDEATQLGAFSLVGGGDSVAFCKTKRICRQSFLCFNRRRCYVRIFRRFRTSRSCCNK